MIENYTKYNAIFFIMFNFYKYEYKYNLYRKLLLRLSRATGISNFLNCSSHSKLKFLTSKMNVKSLEK